MLNPRYRLEKYTTRESSSLNLDIIVFFVLIQDILCAVEFRINTVRFIGKSLLV